MGNGGVGFWRVGSNRRYVRGCSVACYSHVYDSLRIKPPLLCGDSLHMQVISLHSRASNDWLLCPQSSVVPGCNV